MTVGAPQSHNGGTLQAVGQGTVLNVAYTGTAAQSAAFGAATDLVRLCASSLCFYLVGANPTATTSNGSRLPADTVEYVRVNPGQKISVIRSASDGTLNIVECV